MMDKSPVQDGHADAIRDIQQAQAQLLDVFESLSERINTLASVTAPSSDGSHSGADTRQLASGANLGSDYTCPNSSAAEAASEDRKKQARPTVPSQQAGFTSRIVLTQVPRRRSD